MHPRTRTLAAFLVTTGSLVCACSIERNGFVAIDGAAAVVPVPRPGYDASGLDARPMPGAPTDGAVDGASVAPDLGLAPPPPPPPPPDAGPECDPEGCCPRCATGLVCLRATCVPPPPPPPCGALSEACCGESCDTDGLACADGTCVRCGTQPGDPCCGDRCGAGMSCDRIGGTNRCYECGGDREWCCQAFPPCREGRECAWDGHCYGGGGGWP